MESNDTTLNVSIETLVNEDPWQVQYKDDSFSISDNVAFFLFITLGITTLLTCFVITCRQAKRRNSCVPSSCSQWTSCCCVALFFGCLSAGFLSLGTFAHQDQWMAEYTRHGKVRILDTRIVVTSDNVTLQDSSVSSNASNATDDAIWNYTTTTTTEYYMQAQVRVTFGGEWACGRELNETLCDMFVVISECSTRACTNDNSVENCSEEERMQAEVNAMACLINLTGEEYSELLPIDNTSLDPTIPPQFHTDYPNFPLLEGYWNCDLCAFVDKFQYEMHEPDDSIKTAGIGLLCGASLVLGIWILVQVIKWICCPQVPGSFDLVVDDSSNEDDNWQHNENWVVRRRNKRKPFNARRWIHSKQWTAGSPVPKAYDIGDEMEEYYGNRDGLEKTKSNTNGSTVPRAKDLPPVDDEEDEEMPDYWRQWNEGKNGGPQP